MMAQRSPGPAHPPSLPGSLRRLLVTVTAAAALMCGAPAASAHSTSGPDAAHYRTAVTSITPPNPQLTATTLATGESIQISYSGTATVIIAGYYGEPYLRITATGVDENQASPTGPLNQSLFGTIGQDPGTSVKIPPQWKQISTQRVAQWHDHRIHWMNATRPPIAQQDPGHDHLLGNWTVHLTIGATPTDVNGTLTWLAIKPRSQTPLYTALSVVLLLCGGSVLAVRRHRSHTASSAADSSAGAGGGGDNAGLERAPSDGR